MNPDVQADIERRLKKLEGTTVRYRAGEVSATGPLDVKLGGSDVAYEDVRAIIPGSVSTGAQVAVLVFGNDLIVLGEVGAPERRVHGQVNADGTIAGGTGDFSAVRNGAGDYSVTFTVAFTATPSCVPAAGATAAFIAAKLSAVSPPSTAGFRVLVFATSTNTATDGAFTFTADGPA